MSQKSRDVILDVVVAARDRIGCTVGARDDPRRAAEEAGPDATNA